MPALPKSFITIGATLLTAWTGVRLRTRDRGLGGQRAAFRQLLAGLSRADVWRQAGVRPGMPYETFREAVPLQTHASLAAAIERMRGGEADVLWPGTCALFAASAGTADHQARLIPVTAPMLAHFHEACRDALLYYTARVGHAGVFHGRQLFLTGSTALRPADNHSPPKAYVTEWPGLVVLNLPDWAEAHTFEPGAAISHMADWQPKLEAIVARTTGVDVAMLAGSPPWLLQFADTMRAKLAERGHPIENLQAAWPNLECCVHSGVPVAPHLAELRGLLGPQVELHEVYGAAEGVFAAQDTPAAGELRLMAGAGVYFEFVPFVDFDPARIDALGAKAVPLREVTVGVDYVVVITTPAGLARYVVGDVVRFTSVAPPRVSYVGRVDLMLNAFGERLLEREATEALLIVCQRHRWTIVHFHVAPLPAPGLTGQGRGRHEWWVELKPGTVETPTGPQMAAELDVELQRLHTGYAERRRAGRIEPPFVRLVMPGVFKHWMRFHGRLGGHNKIARCRSDRAMADQLAQMTRFAGD